MAHVHEGLVSCLTEIEAKLEASVTTANISLDGFAKRKSRILTIQNGSQKARIPGGQCILKEGSLRALWTEKARKADDAKRAAPEGAVKAEALRWENRRLAEAKDKLEGLTRDQQRRIIQLEEALSELKPRRSNSLSRTVSGTSDPGSPSRQGKLPAADAAALQGALEAARAEAAAAEEARKNAVAERDTARQMLQGLKAMLAQSEALRQSADNSHPVKARTLQLEVDRLQAALARSQAEAAADFRELKAAKAERDLALQTLSEVKSAVAASEAARSATLCELQDAIQRERSSLETKAAELEARCAGYAGALQRAEREGVADKDCIAALRAAVARLHAQAKAAKAEREVAERRQVEAAEDRRRRTLKALRDAEQGRSQLVCDKAAAEHDCAKALAAKEAAEKQVASLKARLDALTDSDAGEGAVRAELSSSSPGPTVSSPASHALAVSEQAQPSSAEAATQTDIAQDTREGNALQQQDVQELHDGARRGEAEAEMLKEELQRSEARVQQQDQELSELREELSRLKAAAAAVPAPAPGPGPGPGLERGEAALESPPETRRGDAAPEGPTTPETASSEGPSRGTDRSAPDSGDAASSSERQLPHRRRRPPSLELWSPGSAHPLSPQPVANSPAVPGTSADSVTSFASARSLSPYAMSTSSSMARSYPLSDAETADVFEDARSRAGSNASSIDIDAYFDAESELDAPANSPVTTPRRSGSGALSQMQEKLTAAVARTEELERERGDAARLARLHGRAVDTQAAALRAAEKSLARKRADVLAANKARAAAEAALAQSIANRRMDDLKVQQIAAELEKALAEAHGEKQRLEEANAEQAALIPALQESCRTAEGQVLELQAELQRMSAQADETSRSLQAAAETARCSEAAARKEVKTLELCNEQLLSEKEWTWDTMQAMEARVDELLWAQAQAAAVPVDAAQRLCIANLEVDLSEARSALAQARTEAAALQQECMQLRQNARAAQPKGTPPSPDPMSKWLAKSLSKAGSPLASWRRSNSHPLSTG